MGLPYVVTVGPLATASSNNIALSQTPSAGALTLNGTTVASGVATLDTARRVLITTSGNESTHSFVISGTNRYSQPISETLVGANASTTYSVLDYLTVTSVVALSAATSSLAVGTNTIASSPIVWLNHHGLPQASLQIVVHGAVSYVVEQTDDNLQTLSGMDNATWFSLSGGTSSSSQLTTIPIHAEYMKLTGTNLSSSAYAVMTVIQAGVANN